MKRLLLIVLAILLPFIIFVTPLAAASLDNTTPVETEEPVAHDVGDNSTNHANESTSVSEVEQPPSQTEPVVNDAVPEVETTEPLATSPQSTESHSSAPQATEPQETTQADTQSTTAPSSSSVSKEIGGYAIIAADGTVTSVIVADQEFADWAMTNPQSPFYGLKIVKQTNATADGNVAGWHGENVTYDESTGNFEINEPNGEKSIIVPKLTATDEAGMDLSSGMFKVVNGQLVQISEYYQASSQRTPKTSETTEVTAESEAVDESQATDVSQVISEGLDLPAPSAESDPPLDESERESTVTETDYNTGEQIVVNIQKALSAVTEQINIFFQNVFQAIKELFTF